MKIPESLKDVLLFRYAIFIVAGFFVTLTVTMGNATDSDDTPTVTPTGLKPNYPAGYNCTPISSPYGSWIDVDGTRRDEIHTGVDVGRLGEWILAPASGTVRAAWKANWKWGTEGALLIQHDRDDLNLTKGPKFYYSEFDHLDFDEIKHFREGQKVKRGQRLARVTHPGENQTYLPEVHWEVWKADHDNLTWRTNRYDAPDWWNDSAELVDPLSLLGLNNPPTEDKSVAIVPFVNGKDYDGFRGFTYIMPCTPK
ncbi:M23 family metallopeptidase [Hyphomicrobium facile]|uniref:M23 family metallopeptidase n=1 Tax=Hyphomicrobium facile TaxID=51670 RepID=UPI001FCDF973|nr:M23 family metallopeptidase [Hyphomicrobium facile]